TDELRRVEGLPNVYSGVTPSEQLRIASRAMSDEELAGLSLSSGAFPALQSGEATRVLQEVNALLQRLLSQGSKMSEQQQQRLGAAAVFILNVLAAAHDASPSATEMAFLLGKNRHTEYFKSSSGKLYFITIIPEKNYGTLSVVERPLRLIRAAIAN